MNGKQKWIIFCSLIAVLGGCNGNRLKIDEKKLSREMLQNGNDEKEQLEREKMLADSLKKLPLAFRFKEDRTIDKAHLPILLDIAGNLDHVRDFSLSDVATKITYIRLQKVPDTGFSRIMKYKYYLTDNAIVAINPSGILLYSREGRFIATVVKNQFTGIQITPEYMSVTGDNTFIGGGTSVWGTGSKLYYKYRNSLTSQSYIMEYDASHPQINLTPRFDPEKPRQIMGQGKAVFDLNYGNKDKPRKGTSNYMWMMSSDFIYHRLGTMMLDHNTYAQLCGNPAEIGGKYMMAIFNQRGDTLTTFTQFEKLNGFTKSVIRGTDGGSQYEINGRFFIRNAFNDTVFCILPPNRLVPVYVLRLGSYKLSKKEGSDPGFDLKGKIIPETWADTKDYIFITFSRDSYNCKNTREKKQLKEYYAIYFKQTRDLYIVKGNPTNYQEDILKNDLDGGLPVWPSSCMLGKKGEILVSLRGKELKDRVKSEQFQRSTATAGKKNELVKFAQSLSDDEDILMIVQ